MKNDHDITWIFFFFFFFFFIMTSAANYVLYHCFDSCRLKLMFLDWYYCWLYLLNLYRGNSVVPQDPWDQEILFVISDILLYQLSIINTKQSKLFQWDGRKQFVIDIFLIYLYVFIDFMIDIDIVNSINY